MMVTVGSLVEATVEMVGTTATEHMMGRVVAITGDLVTVEGMILTRRETPAAVPVEIELPATLRLRKSAVTAL